MGVTAQVQHPGAHPSSISALVLAAPSPGKQTHPPCWQPPSCCDPGEPQPVESSPGRVGWGTGGDTCLQRGQLWQEGGPYPAASS